MTDTVDKLKALLFQPESDAIATLSQRLDKVFDRAGTTERFQASVATVLDGALRDAEIARHDDLATAIAPLIVKTVKTEIHNSTDDLVEALYPATGRMVKAYVASAIKDLTDEINRRLETNPVMLRLNALLTGRSPGELAIANSQRLKVEDVFLIRRATGELLARAPEGTPGSNSDHVLGGILTAINEFTTEAFKSEGSALRQIDLGDTRVYLRVSPTYLLAAKCSGSAPVAAERIFDDEFLSLMDRQHAALEQASASGPGQRAATSQINDLAARLEHKLGELADSRDAPRGIKPLPILITLVALPLLAWLGWSAYAAHRTSVVQDVASTILAKEPQMVGYPTDIKVTDSGRAVTLSGLAPTLAIKNQVVGTLKRALPDVAVRDQLSAVPVGAVDVSPALAALETKVAVNLQTVQASLDEANRTASTQAAKAAALAQSNDELNRRLDEANRRASAEAAKAASLTQTVVDLKARLLPTPREELLAFTRAHAIFFSEQTAYRDDAATRKDLDTLAEILGRDPTLLVRVVGYTDDAGSPATNSALADQRAASVTAALEARNVRKSQIVALHRISPEYNVSPNKGAKSPNRRVEFEVGFHGEGTP